jgi:hypothetical protein
MAAKVDPAISAFAGLGVHFDYGRHFSSTLEQTSNNRRAFRTAAYKNTGQVTRFKKLQETEGIS